MNSDIKYYKDTITRRPGCIVTKIQSFGQERYISYYWASDCDGKGHWTRAFKASTPYAPIDEYFEEITKEEVNKRIFVYEL